MTGAGPAGLGTLFGIGAGPGDPELITLKGLRLLQAVPRVFVPVARAGAASYARAIVDRYLDPSRQEVHELVFAMRGGPAAMADRWAENARVIGDFLASGADAAFVTEGDPLLYSTFVHVRRALAAQRPAAPVVVVPGVSSIQAAAAAAQVPLADGDERLAMLPATRAGDGLREALEAFDTIVVMKPASGRDRILDELDALDLTERAVYVEHCGQPEEVIIRDVRTLRDRPPEYFSLLIVRKA
jgi:precorrin-2/cobalt-factor-2 C20-methyltransferase